MRWDGDDADLPDGIDAALVRHSPSCAPASAPNTLCALAAESPRDGRRRGLAVQMLNGMREWPRVTGCTTS